MHWQYLAGMSALAAFALLILTGCIRHLIEELHTERATGELTR